VVLLALLAVAFALVYAGSAGTIAKGVTIDGVDVGGLSTAEATRALEQHGRAALTQPVEVVADGRTFRVTAAQIGLTPDWSAAVASARREGDGFAPLRGFKRMKLRLFGGDVDVPATYRAGALRAELARIAAKVDRPHREAALVLHGLRPAIVPAQAGRVLDRQAAGATVVAALSSVSRGGKVVLPMKVDQPRVTSTTLAAARTQLATAVSAPVVLTLGPTHYRIPRWRIATLLKLPKNGATKLRISGPAADAFFKAKQRVVDTPAHDAQFVVTTKGIRVKPSTDARVLDVPQTADALLAAAIRRPPNRTAAIAVATQHPKRTTQDALAMGVTGLYSSYTTYYGGVPNRIHNVEVVSHLVDNTLIPPGKEFSFNGTTGERNAAKGLLEAPVIINGELQNGLGGGTCQVSTTVFNAAYEGGLPITARTNHALYISHYPQGRDATVNYPDTDLEFVNDTGHWLLLRTFVGSSSLTVALYGSNPHRRVESETAPLAVTGGAPTETEKNPNLYVGERVTTDSGEPSRKTSVERRVFDANGKLLYDDTWSSYYRSEPRIVDVGTKPKPVEPEKKKKKKPTETGPVTTDLTGTSPATTPPPKPKTQP
jgi:vancomycin resistance protein YoaR